MTGGIVRKAEFAECLPTTVELSCLGAAGWDVDEADESELSVLERLPMGEASELPCPGPGDDRVTDADDDGDTFPSMRGEDDAFPRLAPRGGARHCFTWPSHAESYQTPQTCIVGIPPAMLIGHSPSAW